MNHNLRPDIVSIQKKNNDLYSKSNVKYWRFGLLSPHQYGIIGKNITQRKQAKNLQMLNTCFNNHSQSQKYEDSFLRASSASNHEENLPNNITNITVSTKAIQDTASRGNHGRTDMAYIKKIMAGSKSNYRYLRFELIVHNNCGVAGQNLTQR